MNSASSTAFGMTTVIMINWMTFQWHNSWRHRFEYTRYLTRTGCLSLYQTLTPQLVLCFVLLGILLCIAPYSSWLLINYPNWVVQADCLGTRHVKGIVEVFMQVLGPINGMAWSLNTLDQHNIGDAAFLGYQINTNWTETTWSTCIITVQYIKQ